jgi:hypothetical protein
MEVSWNRDTLKSSILIGFAMKSAIQLWGYPHLFHLTKRSPLGRSLLSSFSSLLLRSESRASRSLLTAGPVSLEFYLCVYVWMYVCMYVHIIYICMYVHIIYICMYVCIQSHLSIAICISVYITYLDIFVYVWSLSGWSQWMVPTLDWPGLINQGATGKKWSA